MTIFNNTTIRLGLGDKLRALVGRTITIATQIDVADETQVQATRQTVIVAPLITRKKSPRAAMAAQSN